MFEIKEVARLYTAERGYRLVVGKFDHPLDAEKTAAKHYYHTSRRKNALFRGNTMQQLRAEIESRMPYGTGLSNVERMVYEILHQRGDNEITETTVYLIDEVNNTFKAI